MKTNTAQPSQSPIISRRLPMAAGLMLMLTSALTARAAVYVDPFLTGSTPGSGEYDTSAVLNGQGPTVGGFSGNWTAAGGSSTFTPIASGLNASGYAGETGGALQFNPNDAIIRSAIRAPDAATFQTLAGFGGTNDQDVYFSTLVNFSNFQTGGSIRFAASSSATSLGTAYQAGITKNGSGDFVVFGSQVPTSGATLALSENTNYLMVMRVGAGAGGDYTSGNNSFAFWILDADGTLPTVAPTPDWAPSNFNRTIVNTSTSTLGGVGILAGNTDATFDELRMGSSWEEVVSIPEPSSLMLVGVAGLVGLTLFRRRRS